MSCYYSTQRLFDAIQIGRSRGEEETARLLNQRLLVNASGGFPSVRTVVLAQYPITTIIRIELKKAQVKYIQFTGVSRGVDSTAGRCRYTSWALALASRLRERRPRSQRRS